MNSLRGIKCNICGDIGKHFSSVCPQRVNVGVPIGLRPVGPGPGSGSGSGSGSGPSHYNGLEANKAPAATEAACLDPQALTAMIRKHPELPSFLSCRACLALPLDAV